MKFGDKERVQFKKDLQQTIIAFEKKYGVKISMLVRENDPNYFGIKVKEIEAAAPAPAPTPSKPVVKPAAPTKPAAPVKPAAPKKNQSLDDMDLDNLNLDDLDFSDLGAEEKTAPAKPAAPKKNNDLDDLDNLDIDSLDFSDLGADDEETTSTKKGSVSSIDDLSNDDFDDMPRSKRSTSTNDDEDRYSQELEKYLGSSYSGLSKEPDNIFEEMKDDLDDLGDISEEELDAYLASSGVYSFSFQAKLIQSEGMAQDYYTDVKNLLLSYNGVKSKVEWDFDLFTYKGKDIARIEVEGDKLFLYLNLDYDDYEGSYDIIEKDKKYPSTKLKVTIASLNAVDSAYELIEDLSTEHHFYPGEDRYDDYHFSYETNDELIARGLIKKK